ncbi:DNA-directed RNA polymerase sigma-70 factor [Bacteroidia bacterium]|nr:DNA-directed RNA polymerase sigma-70 factor [Bacteroidia bacterium]
MKQRTTHDAVEQDDKQLIESFLSGNESAYSAIYNKYTSPLYAYGIGMGFEEEHIQDAIHDVFYKLYFNRKLLKDVENLKFYLFRMLKNRLLDIYKTQTEFYEIDEYEYSFSIKATMLDDLISEEERKDLQKKVEDLMNCLTDRQSEAVYLRFMQEMEYEDIAILLKMTPHATRKLISRAIRRIREQNLPLYLLFFSLKVF